MDHSKRRIIESSSMGGGAAEIARSGGGGGGGGTLSWRSRDPSWWNTAVQLSNNLSSSAKELTSTLASKMDQVPTALAGFTLPWQPVSSHHHKEQQQPPPPPPLLPVKLSDQQQQQQQPVQLLDQQQQQPLPVKISDQQQLWPILPGAAGSGPGPGPGPGLALSSSLTAAELRSLSRVGESCRRTKRMPVDAVTTPCKISRDSSCNDDSGDGFFFFSSHGAAAAFSSASLLQSGNSGSGRGGGLSSVSQRFLLGDDVQLDSLRCNSMEHLPRLENRLAKAIGVRHNVSETVAAATAAATPRRHHHHHHPHPLDASDVKHVNEASLVLSSKAPPPPMHSSAAAQEEEEEEEEEEEVVAAARPPSSPPQKNKSIDAGHQQQGELRAETPVSARVADFRLAIHKEDIFPGNTNMLLPIRLRKPSSSSLSSVASEQGRQKCTPLPANAAALSLFSDDSCDSSRALSKNPIVGGSMRVTRRDLERQQMASFGSDSVHAKAASASSASSSSSGSLPTTPQGESLLTTPRGRGESRASRLFRRLRFGAGKNSSSSSSCSGTTAAAAAGGGVPVDGGLRLECGKQDGPGDRPPSGRPTAPVVAIIRHLGKKDSKAAVVSKAGSAPPVGGFLLPALHGQQHEQGDGTTSMEIVDWNRRAVGITSHTHHHQGQCGRTSTEIVDQNRHIAGIASQTHRHQGQCSRTSMEIADQNRHMVGITSQTHDDDHQGQCRSSGSSGGSDSRWNPLVVNPQQQKPSTRWPFHKWKWTSRPRTSKVVSEEEEEEENTKKYRSVVVAAAANRSSSSSISSSANSSWNRNWWRRSLDGSAFSSEEFFAMSETMYEDASSESFSERGVVVGRQFFSPQPQLKKPLGDGGGGGHGLHRRGSSLGSDRDAAEISCRSWRLPHHHHHHVQCNDVGMISDWLETTPTTRSSGSYGGAAEVGFSSLAVASCRAEDENAAEVFLDCEGESAFVKRRSLSMDDLVVVSWEESPAPPVRPSSLPREQNLTIEEVAALCLSPLKFVFKCREIELFNKFLRRQKKRLLISSSSGAGVHLENNGDCFHIIRSGAECEVSSMVSALLMAWWMENAVVAAPPAKATAGSGKTWHLVPVLSLPRKNMHEHKDVAWLFDACGVDARALLFSDEVELEKLRKAGRLKTEDIGQDLLVTRNEVGSVCTLLGEQVQREADPLLQARYMKTLLLAGILLDTENLDFASIRDTDMATALLVGSGSLGRNGFYKQLTEVESEERVSKLVTRIYGEAPQNSRRSRGEETEADHEHSDKDSYFSSADGCHSHDQTSTSEASTSSSLDEDSPRLQTPPAASLPTNTISSAAHRSAPARFHRLPSPSGVTRSVEANAVAQIREAATGNRSLRASSFSHGSTRHLKTSSIGSGGGSPFSRLRKKLLYNA